MFKRKSIRLLIGLVLTGLALWLSFKDLNWADLEKSFSRLDYFWVVLAVVNVLFTVYAMGWRWRVLLKSKLDVPMGYMFKLNIISQYLNIIIPGRFGELAKAWLPAKHHGVSGSYVLGTIVIEKMFDFFAWVILWVSVPTLFAFQDKVKGYTMAVTICLAMVVALALMIWKREMVRKWLYLFSNILPGKLKQRAVNFLERGMEAFSQLKSSRTALILSLYTALIIFLSTLTNFLLFQAFGLQLSFFEALVLLLLVQVGSAPPSVPGKVGIFEYMVILGLGFFSIDSSEAMGYGLILHLVSYLPKIILGFIFMAGLNISIKKAGEEMDSLETTSDTEKN
ncbi:MAG: flippase-like domain-containing protein [bacterium]|nr:flippase-like domain-containing protein [bacterium]